MHVGQAADDNLIELDAVFDAEAGVFLGQLSHGPSRLLFLALSCSLDRKGERRLREILRLQMVK